MKNYFNIEISSDLNYNGMVVHISYRNDLLAVLNQDKGVDNIEIKIYPSIGKDYWDFSYKEFMTVLKNATELLIQVNQEANE